MLVAGWLPHTLERVLGSERPIVTVASRIYGQLILGFVTAAVGFNVLVVRAVVIIDPRNAGPTPLEDEAGVWVDRMAGLQDDVGRKYCTSVYLHLVR